MPNSGRSIPQRADRPPTTKHPSTDARLCPRNRAIRVNMTPPFAFLASVPVSKTPLEMLYSDDEPAEQGLATGTGQNRNREGARFGMWKERCKNLAAALRGISLGDRSRVRLPMHRRCRRPHLRMRRSASAPACRRRQQLRATRLAHRRACHGRPGEHAVGRRRPYEMDDSHAQPRLHGLHEPACRGRRAEKRRRSRLQKRGEHPDTGGEQPAGHVFSCVQANASLDRGRPGLPSGHRPRAGRADPAHTDVEEGRRTEAALRTQALEFGDPRQSVPACTTAPSPSTPTPR